MITERGTGLAPVIAIDGGAATGKGTARAGVAKELGFHELDSGVLYRAAGLVCKRKGTTNNADCGEIAKTLDIVMNGALVLVDGVDESTLIRSDECGQLASWVGAMPEVRKGLLDFQLRMRQHPGLVADGRDQGIIFEENTFRVFLTADTEKRAWRRVEQLGQRGLPNDFKDVLAGIRERDMQDRSRSIVPMRPHPKALVIDTSDHKPQEVVSMIIRAFRQEF